MSSMKQKEYFDALNLLVDPVQQKKSSMMIKGRLFCLLIRMDSLDAKGRLTLIKEGMRMLTGLILTANGLHRTIVTTDVPLSRPLSYYAAQKRNFGNSWYVV